MSGCDGSARRGRARKLAVLAGALLAIEGMAILADRQWSFRARLLSAFETATRANAAVAEARWGDPERPFRAPHEVPPPRFRTAGSWNPTGEPLDPDTLPPGERVVVLGESAAFGVGCRAEETFAARLGAALAGRGVQVLNAGQVGADAWEVLAAGAQLLARYDPTTLVIFTGNNLWIDWAPPQQPRWNPWAIDVLAALATSRAVAALEFLAIRTALLHTPRQWRVEQIARVDALVGGPGGGAAAAFKDHVEIAGSAYALAHPLEPTAAFGPADWAAVKERFLGRFATSLELLVRQARQRGVRVVLVTMPYRLRLSPAWKHPQFEAVDPAHAERVRELLRRAGALVQDGDCAAAEALVEQALALDPRPPLLHYLRGQCLERRGELDAARAAYAESREQMLGNLGSRASVNAAVRAVAEREQVPLVDAAALFEAWGRAHGDPFQEQLILDDCHPSPTAHALLAEALAPVVTAGAGAVGR